MPSSYSQARAQGKKQGYARIISLETYLKFANKYKISTTKNGVQKTMKQLVKEIYDYETDHSKIKNGLYYH